MPDYAALKKKVDELAARKWDEPVLQARIRKLAREGIPKKKLDPKELLAKSSTAFNCGPRNITLFSRTAPRPQRLP